MSDDSTIDKERDFLGEDSIWFRVSEKGAVSVYGLGRFPVTLYYEQWVALLNDADKLKEFLEQEKHRLKLEAPRGQT